MQISRKAEAEIPEFDSHENARYYFKNKYGDSFVMANSMMVQDEKVYIYHLILDRKNYFDGVKKLQADGFIKDSLDFINSYQPVEIFESGRIHIVH